MPVGLLSACGIDVQFFVLVHKTLTGSVFPVVGVTEVAREKPTPGALVRGLSSLLAPPACNRLAHCDRIKPRVSADNKSQCLLTFQRQGLAVYFCRQKQGTLGSRG